MNGGWGYSKENACILDKNEATLDLTEPFDGVELE
jgi:hypothetical protein